MKFEFENKKNSKHIEIAKLIEFELFIYYNIVY